MRTPKKTSEQVSNPDETDSPKWTKAAECLYRYQPSQQYYARIKTRTREIRKSLETSNLAEAKRKLRDLRKEIERTDPALYKTTLATVADRWLALQGHLAPKTIRRKRDIVEALKADFPKGSQRPVRGIREVEIRDWLALYDFGAPSYNLYLETAKAVFQYAEASQIIARNPARPIERHKRHKPRRPTPTYAEFLSIVEDIRAQPFNGHGADDSADVVRFMGEQGLGQAEVAGLLRAHVDLDGGMLTLYRQKTKTEFVVPLMPNARKVLERWMAKTAEHPDGPAAPVFPFSNPKRSLAGACDRLKLPSFSPRSLRRMFVTRAIRAGIDVQTISLWQGHSDGGKLILDTYSAVLGETHGKAQAALMAGGSE